MNLYEGTMHLHQNEEQMHEMLLFEDNEAFILGNLFKNLYQNYKGFSNYCYHSMSERENALFEVQKYDFITLELNLYLDTHPNDMTMIHLFNKYNSLYNKAVKEFESHYGPLQLNDECNDHQYTWIESPWPWEPQN